MMRERIFVIIQKGIGDDKVSKFYDIFIMITALLSITPMMFKGHYAILDTIDIVTVYILFADYIFRWMTYDYELKAKAAKSMGIADKHSLTQVVTTEPAHRNMRKVWIPFALYPVTPFAVMDLLSLLPSLGLLGHGMRILRLFRVFKVLRYSKTYQYIETVFKKESKTLGYVLIIALAYIFLTALIMFNYEPQTFDSFFEALYWSTSALTTVGYGDIYPVSNVGRFISMVSSLFGIAVIALPAGIVTAGFVEAFNEDRKAQEKAAKRLKKAKKLKKKSRAKNLAVDILGVPEEELEANLKKAAASGDPDLLGDDDLDEDDGEDEEEEDEDD